MHFGINTFLFASPFTHETYAFFTVFKAWGFDSSQRQNVHAGFACPNTVILEVAPAYGPCTGNIFQCFILVAPGLDKPVMLIGPEKRGNPLVSKKTASE